MPVRQRRQGVSQWRVTCEVEARPAAQVAAHELAQVEGGGLLVEPVYQPPRLVRHQDGLVLRPHALIRYARKIPAQSNFFHFFQPCE